MIEEQRPTIEQKRNKRDHDRERFAWGQRQRGLTEDQYAQLRDAAVRSQNAYLRALAEKV